MPALFRIPLAYPRSLIRSAFPERLYALRSSSTIRASYAVALIGVIGAGRHLHRRRRRRRHKSRLALGFNLFKKVRQFTQIIIRDGAVFHFLQKRSQAERVTARTAGRIGRCR